MELLRAMTALAFEAGKREMSRTHLYAAVLRVVMFLLDVLKAGDHIKIEDRTYELCRVKASNGRQHYVLTVDNGRGPAILSDRVVTVPFLPHASYEEHVFFAEHAKAVIDKFGEVLRRDMRRSEAAAHEAISENAIAERIITV